MGLKPLYISFTAHFEQVMAGDGVKSFLTGYGLSTIRVWKSIGIYRLKGG